MDRNEKYAHELCLAGITRYVENHEPVGDFLKAVLSNKLKEAYMYADDYNTEHMWHLVKYIYSNIPSACWGSEEAYKRWTTPKDNEDSEKSEE
jgi:hypothetical protein